MSLCGLGISCEPAPCMHGKDSRKEICHLCDIHKQIMALTDMYKSLSVRVMGQHDFKLNQIDENRKLDKKIDNIVSQLKAWDEDLEYLDSMKLPKRIEKLEKQIANWEEEFYFLKDKLRCYDKKPHKCPLCDGLGGTKISGTIDEYCNVCDGKGIVWG